MHPHGLENALTYGTESCSLNKKLSEANHISDGKLNNICVLHIDPLYKISLLKHKY